MKHIKYLIEISKTVLTWGTLINDVAFKVGRGVQNIPKKGRYRVGQGR